MKSTHIKRLHKHWGKEAKEAKVKEDKAQEYRCQYGCYPSSDCWAYSL